MVCVTNNYFKRSCHSHIFWTFKLVCVLYYLCILCSDKRGPKDLSDEKHYAGNNNQDHNPDYDHEAFLGKEQAETFDQLPPGEAKRRLG